MAVLVPITAVLGLGFSVGAVALGAGFAFTDVQRRGCLVSQKDAEEAMKLKVAMPGLGKEHVRVWADQYGLMIVGKGDKDTEYGDEAPPQYSRRVMLPALADAYKMDQIKVEMKNGVLKVTVPKINVDEKQGKDVFSKTRLHVYCIKQTKQGKDVFEVKVE